MAGQNVKTLIPRVRRALEVEGAPIGATDDELEARIADAIADIILLTHGEWGHELVVTERTAEGVPEEWQVDPELTAAEEGLVAAQVALDYFFHVFRSTKVSERIRNEGQEWEYATSANLMREQWSALLARRDAALQAANAETPVLARYASILHVRDQVGAAYVEPWLGGGIGGQQLLGP